MVRTRAARPARQHRPGSRRHLLESLEPRALFSAGGGFTSGGILGQYFANPTLSGSPAFTRTDARVDFALDGRGPGGSSSPGFAAVDANGGDNWSARWTASLLPKYSEAYYFAVRSDEGVRLTVNGQTLIDNWNAHTAVTDVASIPLTAGQPVSLTLEYYQLSGPAEVSLKWFSTRTPLETIEAATPVGINAGTALDYDNSLMFADAVKMARGWASTNSPWGTIFNFAVDPPNGITDPQGWPTMDAALQLSDAPYRAGTYAISFNGSATLSMNNAYPGVTLSNQHYNRNTNTTTLTMTVVGNSVNGAGANTIALVFTDTRRTATSDTNTGITNLSIMRPTDLASTSAIPAGTLFTPYYKDLISRFTTIRFMDYLATNGNPIQHWSDRPLPGYFTQSQGLGQRDTFSAASVGGSLEYAVALANETGKDIWINIPFGADDDYIANLANLLKYGSDGVNPYTSPQANPLYAPLNANLKVYLEYSNENWNFNPDQTRAAALAAVANGVPLNYDNIYPDYDGGAWTLAQRYLAERSRQISDLFRSVYGDAAMPGTSADPTVRPLLEWQYGGNWGQVGLEYLNGYYNNAFGGSNTASPHPVSYYLWGAGGGWYSGTLDEWAPTVDQIYNSGLDGPSSVRYDVQLARQFGLRTVGYEGGFRVGPDYSNDTQRLANLDPRAADFTRQTLNLFYSYGGDLPIVFTASGAAAPNYSIETDPTGATNIFFRNTYKLQAYAASQQLLPAPLTVGTLLPLTVTPIILAETERFASAGPGAVGTYLLQAPAPGTYQVTIQGTGDSTDTTEHLTLNGQYLATVALPYWGDVATNGTSAPVTFTITDPGLYSLAVYNDGPARIHYFGNVTLTLISDPIVPAAKPGDANGDGTVDLGDFNIWFSNVGVSGTVGSLGGDLNGDNTVDLADFNLWFSHVGA